MLKKREDVSIQEAFTKALENNGIKVKERETLPKHVYVVNNDVVYELHSDFTMKKQPIRTLIRKIFKK